MGDVPIASSAIGQSFGFLSVNLQSDQRLYPLLGDLPLLPDDDPHRIPQPSAKPGDFGFHTGLAIVVDPTSQHLVYLFDSVAVIHTPGTSHESFQFPEKLHEAFIVRFSNHPSTSKRKSLSI